MQFTYELTEEDFIDAYRAHRNRSAFNKWSLRAFLWFLVIAGALGILAAALTHNSPETRELLPLGLAALFWAALVWFLPRWNVRRQFRKQPAAKGPKTVGFESDGIHWTSENGSGISAWKTYIRWLEGRSQILLYNSPYYYIVVSTRTLAPAQLSELRELLKQNIRPAK